MLPAGDFPNTVSGLIFGYGFAGLVLAGYVASLLIRGRNARRDQQLIEETRRQD